jgi:hypothetical protein
VNLVLKREDAGKGRRRLRVVVNISAGEIKMEVFAHDGSINMDKVLIGLTLMAILCFFVQINLLHARLVRLEKRIDKIEKNHVKVSK